MAVKSDDILTKKEKEYLKNVIKLLKTRNRRVIKDSLVDISKTAVNAVVKSSFVDNEYIYLKLEGYVDNFPLHPLFERGTMYKGMMLDKEYTLKELGLPENKRIKVLKSKM